MVEKEVRAIGAADIGGGEAEPGVDAVDPGAGGVDHEIGFHLMFGAVEGVAQPQRSRLRRDERAMIDRPACGMGLHAVEQQLQPQPLGVGDLGVVIGRGRQNVLRHVGKTRARRGAELQAVARQHAAAAAEEIEQLHAEPGDDDAAIPQFGLTAEEAEDRRRNAAEPRTDRQHGLDGLDVVRRVAQQQVPLEGGLRHQPKFAGLEIFDAAMDEPRRRGAGAGAEVVAIDEEAADPLQRQIAKDAGAIDATAENDDVVACGRSSRRGAVGEGVRRLHVRFRSLVQASMMATLIAAPVSAVASASRISDSA